MHGKQATGQDERGFPNRLGLACSRTMKLKNILNVHSYEHLFGLSTKCLGD